VRLRHPWKESRNCGLQIADCGFIRNAASATKQSPIGNSQSAIRN
jgi:hypothetical protein